MRDEFYTFRRQHGLSLECLAQLYSLEQEAFDHYKLIQTYISNDSY